MYITLVLVRRFESECTVVKNQLMVTENGTVTVCSVRHDTLIRIVDNALMSGGKEKL